jgi:hypothetical protein
MWAGWLIKAFNNILPTFFANPYQPPRPLRVHLSRGGE